MLTLFFELLPFAVFIGIVALGEPLSARPTDKPARSRSFCGYLDGEKLLVTDPDGSPVR